MSSFLDSIEQGSGVLLTQKKEEGSKRPDLKGIYVFDREVTFKPGDRFNISAWVSHKPSGMLIRLKEDNWKRDDNPNYRREYVPKKAYEVKDEDDDSIPF